MKDQANEQTLLGILTPSSNTVLEPVTAAMLAGLDDVSAHFSRFRVKQISLDENALGQFDHEAILDAAHLLADAKVNSIIWSGTSSGWLGFDTDEQLCRSITHVTGIKSGSSVLALNELFRRKQVQRFALVSPYLNEVQEQIINNYQKTGIECVAEVHSGVQDNFSFALHNEAKIADMIREVASSKPDAIAVYCTNLGGAPVVAELEKEIDIPIFDTVASGIWSGMTLAGADLKRVKGWGSLFQ